MSDEVACGSLNAVLCGITHKCLVDVDMFVKRDFISYPFFSFWKACLSKLQMGRANPG